MTKKSYYKSMSSSEDRKKEWQKLKRNAKTQYCGCGEPLLKRNGNFLFFRKPRIEKGVKKEINIVVRVTSREPVGFMFTCGNCGMEQMPVVTLSSPTLTKVIPKDRLAKR